MIDETWAVAELLGWSANLWTSANEPVSPLVLRNQAPELVEIYEAACLAIEENPDDALARFQRGVIAQSRQWYELALADFAVVLRVNPQHVRAWLLSSEVLAALGMHEQARTARAKSLELDPQVS